MIKKLDFFRYGVPWGWVACRLTDGKFEVALMDAVAVIILTAIIMRLDAAS